MSQEYEYIQRSADGPNYMSIAMIVMEQSVRCLPRPPLLPYRASCNDWSPRPAGPHRGPSSTRTLVSVCCTHPPSRVPSPSLEIGYADRRLGGASVWFIHNPNAISISYTYLVNVQQLVFRGST